jgi:uncharacterized membrane protein YgcG
MRLAAVAAAATAAAVVAPTHALTNCTNSYAENFNPSCTPPCADDGSCEYPNDPSACEGELLRNVAVRVSVTDADFEFRWAIDYTMGSPHRYGPFSNFGGGGAGGRGAAEMVLCVDGGSGSSDGLDHSLKYMGGGGGFIEIQGLEAAACPQAGEESCVLSPTQYFDPQDQVPPVRFHVGLSPPPPPLDPDVECSLKYVDVFMEFQAGQTCDRRNGCTEACQQSITEVLRICRNQTYAGSSPAQCINDKGSAVECKLKDDESACSSDSPDCTYTEHGPARTFDESAVEGFQKIGPIDCDYSLGYEVCSHARTHATPMPPLLPDSFPSETSSDLVARSLTPALLLWSIHRRLRRQSCEEGVCTLANFNKPSGTFGDLSHCVTMVGAEPVWNRDTGCSTPAFEHCETLFDHVESRCGECHDKTVVKYLTAAAAGLGLCATCDNDPGDVIRAACCPDARMCSEEGEPDTCDEECSAAVTAAGSAEGCPEYFLRNKYTQGTWVDCAGNSLDDLRKNLQRKHGGGGGGGGEDPHGGGGGGGEDPHGGGGGGEDPPPEGTRSLPLWVVVAMVLGAAVLLGAVMYQLCAHHAPPRTLAALSLRRRCVWSTLH